MSRSGYSYDCDDQWAMIRWRGAVKSAIRGQRGQAFFQELLAALDAMPEKRLIANELEKEGSFCTLGVLGHVRGVDMSHLDADDYVNVAHAFGIAQALAQEVVFMNDEWGRFDETPEHRWQRMRAWIASKIAAEAAA